MPREDIEQGHRPLKRSYLGYLHLLSQTHSVEGSNPNLPHYLACLGCRSRCFSGCEQALAPCGQNVQYKSLAYQAHIPDPK